MFTTPVQMPAATQFIDLSTSVVALGSCFAQVIGHRLLENKFPVLVNPYGTLYNPVALFELIRDTVQQALPAADTYLSRDGLYFNYQFHSSLAAPSQEALQDRIAATIGHTHQHLAAAKFLMLTLGTAFGYERQDHPRMVSNCHKMPAHTFRKRLLDTAEIVQSFDQMYQAFQTFNPELHLILTVSPVRHLRDTLVQNSVSKATLRVAADLLQKKYLDKIYYFPSYELMMDELRDYRFYDADMLHPSQVAEDYIWQKFCGALMNSDTRSFLQQWSRLARAVQHRPLHPASDQHQRFLKKTIQELRQLSKVINVQQEIASLEKQLL